jgi:cell wall-associated NlpC family hydrolase
VADVETILRIALSQLGKPYRFGAVAQSTDPNPAAFDCSSFVRWCCDRAQVAPPMPPLTYYQHIHCVTHGTMIGVDSAIATRGALLFIHRDRAGNPVTPAEPLNPAAFSIAHVAFSLGDGRTVEAANQVLDVCVRSAPALRFTHAAVIPGIGAPSGPVAPGGNFPDPMEDKPYLVRGATGPAVVEMQQLLIALGVSSELTAAGATGNFFDRTERALRTFQQMVRSQSGDARMVVDGECGPVTWAWLHQLAG